MSTSTGTLDSFITYLPFGATRTGSVNTPKEFTGQRLDATGLYYYGARYYDATIGRFISPDTVGQNLYDPQSLNRYTYCQNNPLIYTDPSGNIVEFAGTDIIHQYLLEGPNGPNWNIVQDYFALVGAWVTLSTIVPELTSYLEDRSETIVIGSADLSKIGASGLTAAATGIGGAILIDRGTIDMGINVTAAILGHEALHAAFEVSRDGFTLPSLAEEAFCYSMQYSLDIALTGSCNNSTAIACSGFNPWLPMSDLKDQLNGRNGRNSIIGALRVTGNYTAWYYLFGHAIWPTGPATGSQNSLIQTARKFFPLPYRDFLPYC